MTLRQPLTAAINRVLSACLLLGICCSASAQNTTEAPTHEATENQQGTAKIAEGDALTKDNESQSTEGSDNTKILPTPLGQGQSYTQNSAREQALANQYTQSPIGQGESVWLEASAEKFLAIWQLDNSGNTAGAVLLLPDEEINVVENQIIQNLQRHLSRHGWSTLTLSLPSTFQASLPPASALPKIIPKTESNTTAKDIADPTKEEASTPTEKDIVFKDEEEKKEGSENTAAAKDKEQSPDSLAATPEAQPQQVINYEPKAQARIESAMAFLKEKGQFNNVIIAQGIGSARALYYLGSNENNQNTEPTNTTTDSHFRAIVLIDAELQLKELPEWNAYSVLETLKIPTLDIVHKSYSQSPPAAIIRNQEKRLEVTRRAKIAVYSQREILPATLSKNESRLTKVIRGFLNKHAR